MIHGCIYCDDSTYNTCMSCPHTLICPSCAIKVGKWCHTCKTDARKRKENQATQKSNMRIDLFGGLSGVLIVSIITIISVATCQDVERQNPLKTIKGSQKVYVQEGEQ